MKTVTINIMDSVDIENITPDTITEDITTATHYNNIRNLIDVLTAEKKAMDKALIAKHGNVSYKSDFLSVSVYDSYDLDRERLENDLGKEVFNSYKTKAKHTEKVVRFGK